MKAERLRAGFWRRMFSFFIDAVVVFLPFQVLAAILFALTAGAVQLAAGGFATTVCYKATSIAPDLKPPPPANPTAAKVCKTTLFGAETARQLTVSHSTKTGNTTYKISETYSLDRNDKQVDAWSLEWPACIALLAYLIWFKLRKPGTLGDRACKISVVDDSLKTSLPPSLRQMAIRYSALLGPFVVTGAMILGAEKLVGGTAEDMMKYHYLAVALAIMAPAMVYYFVCFVQIVRKCDPYWDRWAMTAVLRRSTADL
ncbi:MAG: RDD family protein [Afipia sp.]|nr:RDD family protein [Afipia sp.]